MPRYSGIGMRRPKKKKIEQSNEALEEPPAPPAAPEPAVPPTPEPKQVKSRPAQSPGMKAVKAAAYGARKAALVATKAMKMFEKKTELSVAKSKGIWARMWAIEREWKKAKKHVNIRFIERIHKAELQLKDVEIFVLRERVLALALAVDARDAANAEKEARIARLARLLRMRKCK